MQVILDTNVLIGALISPLGPPNTIYRAWRKKRFTLVTAEIQLQEIRRVSHYPKLKTILPPHRVGTLINQLRLCEVLTSLPDLSPTLLIKDANDRFLLAAALAGDVDYLVTGDRSAGLLELKKIKRTTILTPSEFCVILS